MNVGIMTAFLKSPAAANERNRRTIYTAACLVIGDEVLGGKVSSSAACCFETEARTPSNSSKTVKMFNPPLSKSLD